MARRRTPESGAVRRQPTGERAGEASRRAPAAANHPLDTLSRSPRRWRFREGKRGFTVKMDGRYEVNDDLALRRFAIPGLGIAYLPSYFVRDPIDSGALVPLLRDYTIEPLPICIIYPSRELLTPARRALLDHLMACAPPNSFV